MAVADDFFSQLVSSGTRAISRRYIRTGSSSIGGVCVRGGRRLLASLRLIARRRAASPRGRLGIFCVSVVRVAHDAAAPPAPFSSSISEIRPSHNSGPPEPIVAPAICVRGCVSGRLVLRYCREGLAKKAVLFGIAQGFAWPGALLFPDLRDCCLRQGPCQFLTAIESVLF